MPSTSPDKGRGGAWAVAETTAEEPGATQPAGQEQQTQLLQEAQVAAPDKAEHLKAAHAKSTIEKFKGLVVARNWKELAGDPELTHISHQLEEIIETQAAMCTKRKREAREKWPASLRP